MCVVVVRSLFLRCPACVSLRLCACPSARAYVRVCEIDRSAPNVGTEENKHKKKTVREAREKVAKHKPLRLSGSGAGAVDLLLSFRIVADISVCAYDDEQEWV